MSNKPANISRMFAALSQKVNVWVAGLYFIHRGHKRRQEEATHNTSLPLFKKLTSNSSASNTDNQASFTAKATSGFVVINNGLVRWSDKPVFAASYFAGKANTFAAGATKAAKPANAFAGPSTSLVVPVHVPAAVISGFETGTSCLAPKFNGSVSATSPPVSTASPFAATTSAFAGSSNRIAWTNNSFAAFLIYLWHRITRILKPSYSEYISADASRHYFTDDGFDFIETEIPGFYYQGKWQVIFPQEPDFELLLWQIEQGRRYSSPDKRYYGNCCCEFNYRLPAVGIRILWQIKEIQPDYSYIPDQRINTFKHLGKPSSGPSPPLAFYCRPAA